MREKMTEDDNAMLLGRKRFLKSMGTISTTPVTSNALTSLHNIISQRTCALDETSKQRLQRRLQKLANAAHISFAERPLL